MAVLQKVKINNEWVPVSGSNVNSGGGITEEKEVYIGEEAPTDDGAKLWIDTDDESGETGEGSSGGNGGSTSDISHNVYFLPAGAMAEEYDFTSDEAQEFKTAINTPNTAFYISFVEGSIAFHFPLNVIQYSLGKVYLKFLQTETNNEIMAFSLWCWDISYDDESMNSTFEQIVKTIK